MLGLRWWYDALRPLVRIAFFGRLLASSTGFIVSDLEVSPLPPPLVAVDIAYLIIRHDDRVFSRDVTAAILVSQNNETAAMLVSQTSPVGVELCSNANAFFCYNKFA